MTKVGKNRLSDEEVGKLFYLLCEAVVGMRNTDEAASFLKDLLSYSEAEMIAKRLKIAMLLEEGKKYEEIIEKMKTSSTTIARVHEWLGTSGEGLRTVMKRVSSEEKLEKLPTQTYSSWRGLKKRYVSYFWPQLILEEIIVTANNRQRERLERVMKQMEKAKEKPAVYAHIKKLLRQRQ